LKKLILLLSAALVPASALLADEAPAGCPFPASADFAAFEFTGRHAEYTDADTWYPSWASDGNLYSPWTDGRVNGLVSNSNGHNATTGSAAILGDDPLRLTVTNQSVYVSAPEPYEGRYPCGSLVYNGVWYYGTYCLCGKPYIMHDKTAYNWPWMGTFVGFRTSADLGRTWTQTPRTPDKPLFGECGLQGRPVKIGAPHFVDFGKNMAHSPDGKAYLVAQGSADGADRRFGYNSWITADSVYLLRVTPSVATINEASSYEFWDGSGWTREFAEIRPVADWRDRMGCATMTYNAPLKRYFLCVTDGGTTASYFNTCILESEAASGPFRLVQYWRHFGEQGYFVNIPSKFISADGLTMWLSYSANFAANWNGNHIQPKPEGSRYAMCLREMKLRRR
jgi:hypothetical protein